MQIQVKRKGEMMYVVLSCIPCASGLDAGTVRVTVKAEVTEALDLVKKAKVGNAAWMLGLHQQGKEIQPEHLQGPGGIMQHRCGPTDKKFNV